MTKAAEAILYELTATEHAKAVDTAKKVLQGLGLTRAQVYEWSKPRSVALLRAEIGELRIERVSLKRRLNRASDALKREGIYFGDRHKETFTERSQKADPMCPICGGDIPCRCHEPDGAI